MCKSIVNIVKLFFFNLWLKMTVFSKRPYKSTTTTIDNLNSNTNSNGDTLYSPLRNRMDRQSRNYSLIIIILVIVITILTFFGISLAYSYNLYRYNNSGGSSGNGKYESSHTTSYQQQLSSAVVGWQQQYDQLFLYNADNIVNLPTVLHSLNTNAGGGDAKNRRNDLISIHDYNNSARESIDVTYDINEPNNGFTLHSDYPLNHLMAGYAEYTYRGVHFAANLAKYHTVQEPIRYVSSTVSVYLKKTKMELMEKTSPNENKMYVVKLRRLLDNVEFYFVNIICPPLSTKQSNLVDVANYLWVIQAFKTLKFHHNDAPYIITGSFNAHGFEDVFKRDKDGKDFHIAEFNKTPSRLYAMSATEGFIVSKSLYERIEYTTDFPSFQSPDRLIMSARLYIKSDKKPHGVFLNIDEWNLKQYYQTRINNPLSRLSYRGAASASDDHDPSPFDNNYYGKSSFIDNLYKFYPQKTTGVSIINQPALPVHSVHNRNKNRMIYSGVRGGKTTENRRGEEYNNDSESIGSIGSSELPNLASAPSGSTLSIIDGVPNLNKRVVVNPITPPNTKIVKPSQIPPSPPPPLPEINTNNDGSNKQTKSVAAKPTKTTTTTGNGNGGVVTKKKE